MYSNARFGSIHFLFQIEFVNENNDVKSFRSAEIPTVILILDLTWLDDTVFAC